jgi:hypothetical protein
MMTLLTVYQGICALLAILIGVVVIRSRRLDVQTTGAAVLIPLLLRLFLVK